MPCKSLSCLLDLLVDGKVDSSEKYVLEEVKCAANLLGIDTFFLSRVENKELVNSVDNDSIVLSVPIFDDSDLTQPCESSVKTSNLSIILPLIEEKEEESKSTELLRRKELIKNDNVEIDTSAE